MGPLDRSLLQFGWIAIISYYRNKRKYSKEEESYVNQLQIMCANGFYFSALQSNLKMLLFVFIL